MSAIILGLLAETFVHPGTGQTTGAIDLPVARERATHYPFIPGSSLKGAFKESAERFHPAPTDGNGNRQVSSKVKGWFGEQDNAGAVQFSDARLLLLPIRSFADSYKWVTCPLLLERFHRDCARAGVPVGYAPEAVKVDPKKYLNGKAAAPQGASPPVLYLEEWTFALQSQVDAKVVDELKTLIPYGGTQARLSQQLVVLADADFERFARSGLHIAARNQLTERKTSNNLWYEESLPPDTLMYTLLSDRSAGASNAQDVAKMFDGDDKRYLQVGGNETVGHGWFAVSKRSGNHA